MSAANIEQSAQTEPGGEGGIALLAGERWQAASARDRRFVVALGATALLHVALVIGIASAVPRHIGDPSGANNAISIAIVTEADLKSMSSVPETSGPPPGAPAKSTPTPAPPAKAEPPVKPELQSKPDQPETLRQSIAEDAPEAKNTLEPELEPGPAPAEKKPAAKVQPQPQPLVKPKQTAKLDLAPPSPVLNAPFGGSGRSAGFERPPGITRSGANDEFARRVIGALQQTMPQLSDTLGSVTVRIVLNTNGNVAEVKVVRPSTIAGLDQSVVFAVKQTSFPFPPPNSIDVDRIFQVRYLYR